MEQWRWWHWKCQWNVCWTSYFFGLISIFMYLNSDLLYYRYTSIQKCVRTKCDFIPFTDLGKYYEEGLFGYNLVCNHDDCNKSFQHCITDNKIMYICSKSQQPLTNKCGDIMYDKDGNNTYCCRQAICQSHYSSKRPSRSSTNKKQKIDDLTNVLV